ncbi:MAG TPA: type IV secretion system DNA-binding domain-containing protein [Ktedonobacteraceae bacterium]|nr:type IV secretion system DNA-binding domain-containing protein [Ktedonobacteraceae bacterium]
MANVSLPAVILGRDIDTGQEVFLEQSQRLGGTYVIGKTGSGKTTLLVNMILQDIQQDMGLCFIDVHGDAITDILKRLPDKREQDVILLDLLDKDYAFGLNLFECQNPQDKEEVSLVTSMVMGVFAKLFTETGDLFKEAPTMAETLQNTVPVLLAHQNPCMTMAEIPLLLTNEDARAKLVKPVSNTQVKLFWETYNRWKRDAQEEIVGSTRRRVGNFLTDSLILEIVGQSETSLSFRRIMDEGKILLVKLSRQHELITSLIGSVIVGQIAQAAFSRKNIPEEKRVQFNLYADEYQRFSTPTFAELLAEVRKYRIASCVAHQWRGQLDKQNREATINAANLIVYQVSGEDAQELVSQFNITPAQIGEKRKEILTPVSKPIDQILAGHTHPNEGVNRFASYYFRRQSSVDKNQELVRYSIGIWLTETGDNKACSEINDLLYMVMREKRTDNIVTSEEFKRFLMHVFRNIFYSKPEYKFIDSGKPLLFQSGGIPVPYYKLVYSVQEESIKSSSYTPKFYDRRGLSMGNGATIYTREFISPVAKYLDDVIMALIQTIYASSSQEKRWATALQLKTLMLERYYKHIEAFERLKLIKRVITPYVEVDSKYADFTVVDEFSGLYKEDRLKVFEQYFKALSIFLPDLKEVIEALVLEPITDRSGLYEVEPIMQTYADAANQRANNLANPKQKYTASIKLADGNEHNIQAIPFRQADSNDVYLSRLERIVAQTRSTYCKKREIVAGEIETRQMLLMQSEKKQPRTRQEDE